MYEAGFLVEDEIMRRMKLKIQIQIQTQTQIKFLLILQLIQEEKRGQKEYYENIQYASI